jgi:hypothetical protein
MGWPGSELVERAAPKAGERRMFWGREFVWKGSDWEPVEGKKIEPSKPPPESKKPSDETATILAKYKLKFTGPGHEKLAQAVERGIDRAADICKIYPPMCHHNLGITRDKMPQFPSNEVRDGFLEKLKKKGVRITQGKVKVGHLKASQQEIQAKKTVGIAGAYLDGKLPVIKNAIVISKDGYIVDGHHRWSALLAIGSDEEMNVIRVGVPIRELLDMVNEHPGVEHREFSAPGHHKESLSDTDRHNLRGGDYVRVRTARAFIKHQEPWWPSFALARFSGPAKVIGQYAGSGSLPRRGPRMPEPGGRPDSSKSIDVDHSGQSMKVRYRNQTLYVPLDDVDELLPGSKVDRAGRTARAARSAKFRADRDRATRAAEGTDRYVRLADAMAATWTAIKETRGASLDFTAQPVDIHGVGVSPSASPADMEAGRFQNYADGPTIRRRKPGYKPTRIGSAGAGGRIARAYGPAKRMA